MTPYNEHFKDYENWLISQGLKINNYSRIAKKFWSFCKTSCIEKATELTIKRFTENKSYHSSIKKYLKFCNNTIHDLNFDPIIKKIEGEIWVNVYDSLGYKVSNFGRLYNVRTERILKCSPSKRDAYIRVSANWKREGDYIKNRSTRTLHDIVFFSFNPSIKKENSKNIDHKDNNRSNNNLSNLRYVSVYENVQNRFKLNEDMIQEIRNCISIGFSNNEILIYFSIKYYSSMNKKGRKNSKDNE